MKYVPLGLALVFSPVTVATQMEGLGAKYYDDVSVINHVSNKGLVPEVIIGDRLFIMEFSWLKDIAKTTGAVVNQSDEASWLCLVSKDITYWFISDNEMGHGDLTAIAIARNGRQKGCSSYMGYLRVSIKGIPLLNASTEDLKSKFSHEPVSDIMKYCIDTQSYGNFTQSNCLQYYFENKTVKGVLISQVTAS